MSIYLVAAYALFWIGTFALVVSMWVRQRRIEREIEMLEERLAQQK